MASLLEALKFALGNVQRGGQQAREFLAGNPDPNVLGEAPFSSAVTLPTKFNPGLVRVLKLADLERNPAALEEISKGRSLINPEPLEMYRSTTPNRNYHQVIADGLGYDSAEEAVRSGLIRHEAYKDETLFSTAYAKKALEAIKRIMRANPTDTLKMDLYESPGASKFPKYVDSLAIPYKESSFDRFINDLLREGKLK